MSDFPAPVPAPVPAPDPAPVPAVVSPSATAEPRCEVLYDVAYIESRNRLTTLIRMIMMIPHAVVVYFWGIFAQALGVVQWFVILFTGKRNEGLFKLQNDYLGYSTRVSSYAGLMYDEYPPFGTDPGATGVTYSLDYTATANRLTNVFRLVWAIPAMIIVYILSIAGFFVVVVSWFAILITGKHPRGMFDFMLKVHRYYARATSYLMLMTDTYPKYE